MLVQLLSPKMMFVEPIRCWREKKRKKREVTFAECLSLKKTTLTAATHQYCYLLATAAGQLSHATPPPPSPTTTTNNNNNNDDDENASNG